jgi:hypothetical protein
VLFASARKLGSGKKVLLFAWTGSLKQTADENSATKRWNGWLFCNCSQKKMILIFCFLS